MYEHFLELQREQLDDFNLLLEQLRVNNGIIWEEPDEKKVITREGISK